MDDDAELVTSIQGNGREVLHALRKRDAVRSAVSSHPTILLRSPDRGQVELVVAEDGEGVRVYPLNFAQLRCLLVQLAQVVSSWPVAGLEPPNNGGVK